MATALRLDENSDQAFVVLGSIKTFHDWEYEEAESALKSAIQLKPDNVEAFTVYKELLIALERFEEAEQILRRAIKIEPHSLILPVSMARLYLCWRKYDEGLKTLQPVIEIDPHLSPALLTLGNLYATAIENHARQSIYDRCALRSSRRARQSFRMAAKSLRYANESTYSPKSRSAFR